MEQVERKEFPGNDASWYRALLIDTDGTSPESIETPQEEDLPTADVAATTGDGAAEAGETVRIARSVAVFPPAPETEENSGTDDHPDVAAPEAPGAEEDRLGEVQESVESGDATIMADQDPPLMTAVPAIEGDDSSVENTSEMVGKLWTASEPGSPLDTWEPDDMDRAISSSRSFRWTSLIGSLAVIGLIVVGLVFLPSIARGRADDHMDMFSTVLRELRGELPDTQGSLEIATDPVTEISELEGLSTQLTVLAAKASAVDEAAQAELPKTPPLTSSAPIDELEPVRQRLEPLGTVANTIQRRIANLVEYRVLMGGFLALPELPDSADAATQAELRVVLAAAQAESAAILADLPSDVSLDAHGELARTTNDRFASWQVEYLEALRTENVAGARELLAELDTLLTNLDNELITPLAQIRRQTDTDLIDLARSIDEVVLVINGGTV